MHVKVWTIRTDTAGLLPWFLRQLAQDVFFERHGVGVEFSPTA